MSLVRKNSHLNDTSLAFESIQSKKEDIIVLFRTMETLQLDDLMWPTVVPLKGKLELGVLTFSGFIA